MSRQTNVNIVPFRFPWIRSGKVVNKRYDKTKEVPNGKNSKRSKVRAPYQR